MQWPRIVGALGLCALLCALGVVLVLDYRGLASRHARATIQTFWPTRPSQDQKVFDRRVRRQLNVDRVVGGGFALGGLAVMIGIAAHVLFS